jgi:hypothetical protein
MTSSRVHCFFSASIMLLFVGTATGARAERFDEHDLRGDYVFTFDGSAGAVPVAAVGRFFADGKGNILNASRTLVVGGAAFEQNFTCKYVVRSDGRGNADCDVIGANPETFSFLVFDHGNQAYFVGTTPGVVIRGNVIQQK